MTARIPGSAFMVHRVIQATVDGLVTESERIARQEGRP